MDVLAWTYRIQYINTPACTSGVFPCIAFVDPNVLKSSASEPTNQTTKHRVCSGGDLIGMRGTEHGRVIELFASEHQADWQPLGALAGHRD